MHRFLVLCLALVSGTMLAGSAAAQYHFPVSTEASFGFRVGHGGTYTTRSGAAIDVVLGYRLRDTPAGTLIGAFNLGVQSPVTSDLVCIPVGPIANGECAPNFPIFFSGGALLGVQRGSARTASARILAGPTYYLPLGSDHDAGGALGLQGRVDVSTPPWMHTAVVASLRHSVLPSFRGDPLGITSFGLGLRIQ
jgi:hypothetical protein